MDVLQHGDWDNPAGADDVRRALGDIEDRIVLEVLSGRPSLGDLTSAALWVRGDGDLKAREAQDLSPGAIQIVGILEALKDEDLAP